MCMWPILAGQYAKWASDKEDLDKLQSFWENVFWTDKTKIEPSGNAHKQFVYRKQNKAYKGITMNS